MRILGPADFTRQRWANGRGETVELFRIPAPGGGFRARLSVAQVVQDGPFSRFPGIARNLTVIAGPGFRLVGPGLALDCAPLRPVAFDGGAQVSAQGTDAGPSQDFNVMTDARLPRPDVRVLDRGEVAPGGLLALFALGPAQVNGQILSPGHLAVTPEGVNLKGQVILARVWLDG